VFLLQLLDFGTFLGEFVIQKVVFLHHFLLKLDHEVIVLVSLFEADLSLGELLLNRVEFNSDIFFFVFDLS